MRGGAQQGGGEHIQRVAAALDGFDDLFELVLQRGFAGAVADGKLGAGSPQTAAASAALIGRGSEKVGWAVKTAAKRVRSTAVAVFACRRTGLSSGIRPGKAGGDGVQGGFGALEAADIGADARGAVGEGGVAQGADGGLQLVHGDARRHRCAG